MKKALQFSTLFAATAGVLGALLRRWQLSAGIDEKGLYPAGHPGWIGYVVLSIAAIAALWLVTQETENDPTWNRNFPKGLPGAAFVAAGYALAAAGIGIYTKSMLPDGNMLHMAAYWGGFVCMAVLLVLCVQIGSGKKPFAPAYLAPSIYFALQLFLLSKEYSGEPELLRFLPQAAALAASALASYQLWGFAADYGDRRKSLFWSLTAGCLCLAAAPGAHVMYVAAGLWHLLSHCTLFLPPVEIVEENPEEVPNEPAPEEGEE